jgi:hypothetical protein
MPTPQLNHQQFQALWQTAKSGPVFQQAAAQPIQVDLSLSGILDQYLTMAGQAKDKGQMSQQDYSDLSAAITPLKAVLARVNDKQLVAGWRAQHAAAITQQINTKVAAAQKL